MWEKNQRTAAQKLQSAIFVFARAQYHWNGFLQLPPPTKQSLEKDLRNGLGDVEVCRDADYIYTSKHDRVVLYMRGLSIILALMWCDSHVPGVSPPPSGLRRTLQSSGSYRHNCVPRPTALHCNCAVNIRDGSRRDSANQCEASPPIPPGGHRVRMKGTPILNQRYTPPPKRSDSLQCTQVHTGDTHTARCTTSGGTDGHTATHTSTHTHTQTTTHR